MIQFRAPKYSCEPSKKLAKFWNLRNTRTLMIPPWQKLGKKSNWDYMKWLPSLHPWSIERPTLDLFSKKACQIVFFISIQILVLHSYTKCNSIFTYLGPLRSISIWGVTMRLQAFSIATKYWYKCQCDRRKLLKLISSARKHQII